MTQGFGLYLVSSNISGIQGSIGATASEASWLTTAYFATAMWSTLLVVKARLHFGLRAFASVGIVGFVLVGGLHLFTNSLASAIAARAALGIAAAPLSTLAILYMLEAFPKPLAPVGLLLGFTVLQLPLPLSRIISNDLLEIGQWHGLFLLDIALSALSLAAVLAVALTPVARQHSFNRGDLVSFLLYVIGLGLLCIVVSQGRVRWWTDTAWLGVCLACAIGCIALFAIVELRRTNPLLNLRWLATPYMLRFVFAILLFRVVLSEQNIAVVGLMTALGQSNEQMQTLFALATIGTLAGFALAIMIAMKKGMYVLTLIAAGLVVATASLDAGSTSLTRPHDLYVTQTILAAALAIFFAASCLFGFGPVIRDGMRNIVTFLAAFSGAQYMGSLLGAAWVSSVVQDRQQWHYAALLQRLSLADPQTAERVSQLAGSVGRFVVDPAARAAQGISLLNQQIARESVVLAYNDIFQYIAAIAAGMLVWLAMLARRAAVREVISGTSTAAPVE